MNRNIAYFKQAERDANERYFSADDDYEAELDKLDEEDFDDFDDEWEGFDDEWEGVDDEWDDEFQGAAGGPGSKTVNASTPYIVRVANSTASAVSNVIVLDSFTNMADTNNFGNPVAIALSINNPNTTYLQFLRQIASQPFETGELYLQSTTTAQVVETITVRHSDSTGTRLDKLLIPLRDPYQFQNGSLVHKIPHMVDGFTRYTINQILASATLDIYIYPKTKINPARAVKGKRATVSYRNPGNVKKQRILMAPSRPSRAGRRFRRLGR